MASTPETAPTPDASTSPAPPAPTPPANAAPPPTQASPSPPKQTPPSPPPPATTASPPPNAPTPPPPPADHTRGAASATSSPPPPPPPTSWSSPPPPPPTHRALAPPHHSPPRSHTRSPPPSQHHHTVNVPLIVGVTVGAGVFFMLMMLTIALCCCKKKKKRPQDGIAYYSDPPRKHKGSEYYPHSGQNPKWQNNTTGLIPPPPGANPAGGHGWRPPPPLPPGAMMVHSSDMSSNFSGPHGPVLPPPSPNIALGFNKSTFTYEELEAATCGFSPANLLGQGGFGYVYKGYLQNGKEIAVKQLKSGSGQGEREFQAEVEIISRVHHRHLVSLVGYCITGAQRILVYEFVPNSSLEHHLHGKGQPVIDFSTRLKIALGSAKGLAYLHEDCHPRIIHRDIKTANILLDYNFEAQVADFGLAKLSSDTNTHVSTRVMGTFGYLAPEYASSGKLTEKSDVFSYGVMLLELITGRRPVDTTNSYTEDCLVDWARPVMQDALQDGKCEELADPVLEGKYNPNEMLRMVACAAACVRHSAKRRPKMSQIVRALEGDVSLEDLNDGSRLGQSFNLTSGSSDYDGSYNADMRRMRAVGSLGGSGEYPSTSTSDGGSSRRTP